MLVLALGWLLLKLKDRAYTNTDALDISHEMLDVARGKNLNKKLICFPTD